MTKTNYRILTSDRAADGIPAEIRHFRWMTNMYEPKTIAKLTYSDSTLHLMLETYEKNPIAIHTQPFSDVYKDSCMEFFFSVNDSCMYFNVELNSAGAYITAYGPDRHDRCNVDIFTSSPVVLINPDRWSVFADISLEKVKKITGYTSINYLKGNFYKCGDETEFAHYGMWSPVLTDYPDFHRPEFFSLLIHESEM